MLEAAFISIHPQFLSSYSNFGVYKSAQSKQLAKFTFVDLRDFSLDKHGTVDGRPYGGGDGMVLRPEPLANAVTALPASSYVINTSPSGKPFKQNDAERLLALSRPLALICGRFSGVDQRFIDQYVDEEFSVGDFVLSGGELPALAIVDAVLRLVPGVLGHPKSSFYDSFAAGMDKKLEHPLYTRPPVFAGTEVPEVLNSGNHSEIESWRKSEAHARTQALRPELLSSKK